MNTESFRFKVGVFECIAVSDGGFTYPAGWFFAGVPQERYEQVLRENNLPPEQITTPYICLVINTGGQWVLVDTGAGGLAPSTGKLLQNLQAEGIAPGDIDTVILSHGHPDHIGGNVGGEGKPAFPKARYVMWKSEWDFWTAETTLEKLATGELMGPELGSMVATWVRNNLPPIQGQLDLVDHETEIVAGIHAISAPGHTPGHMALAIASGSEQLLFGADTVLHPIYLEQPDWYPIFDFLPEQAMTTRRQFLNRAAAEKALVHLYHFPFPGLGHLSQKGQGWQWQPI